MAVAVLAVLSGMILIATPSDGISSDEPLLYGSTDLPYGSMDVQWDDLRDGAIYYVIQGGHIEIDFRYVGKPDGVENNMAGSGLNVDYSRSIISGDLQGTAVISMDSKYVALSMVKGDSSDLPAFDGKGTTTFPLAVQMGTVTSSKVLMLSEVPDSELEVFGLPDGLEVVSYDCRNIVKIEGRATEEVVTSIVIGYTGVDGVYHEDSFPMVTKGVYEVQYDAAGGVSSKDSDLVVYGGYVSLPDVEYEGHQLIGWYSDEGFVGMPGESVPVNSDTVYTAQWSYGSETDDGGDDNRLVAIVLVVIGIILAVAAFLTGYFILGIPAVVCVVIGLLFLFRILRY